MSDEMNYWHKQLPNQPLFPDLLWSRPENKRLAGKLLIIGGNLYGFAAPAEAYRVAVEAGIGSARVLLPDGLRKTLLKVLDGADFAPSNPSGSFSREALAAWVEQAAWADGVLLAGDMGRNSETAIVVESFLAKYSGLVVLTEDAADYVTANPRLVLNRAQTTLVISLAQLQKLAKTAGWPKAVTFNMDLLQLVEWLREFSSENSPNIIVRHMDNIFVAVDGQLSTTKQSGDASAIWRVATAAKAAVWWLQHSNQAFEALSTSVSAIDNNEES